MCVWCRTHTSFIGEETSCHTFLYCKLQGCAHCTTCYCCRFKRTDNNVMECCRDCCNVCKNYDQRTYYIKCCHDRHDQFSNFCDSLHTTCEYKQRNNCYKNTHCNLRNSECSVPWCCDWVRLNCIAHESNCKNSCQNFSERSFKCSSYVIYRTTGYGSVITDLLELLSHNRFCEDRWHSEECADPHPEDCSRTTDCNCSCSSGDITGTNLSSNRCCKCLERRHSVFSGIPFLAKKSAKSSVPSIFKTTDLDKSMLKCEQQANTYKCYDQHRSC